MQSTLTAGDLIALGALSQLSKAEQVTKAKNKAAVENLLVKALSQQQAAPAVPGRFSKKTR